MKYLFLVCLILFSYQSVQGQDILIKNINILSMTSDKVLKSKSVLIRNGKIEKIGSFKNLSRNTSCQIINGTGRFLMPSLADMHVHLPKKDKVNHLLQMSVAAGITHMRIMNNGYPQLALKKDLEKDKDGIAPHLFYSYLIKRDFEKTSSVQMDSLLKEVKKQGIDFIKLYSLANEEVYDHLMTSAKKNNMIVCGHYPHYKEKDKWKSVGIEKVLKSDLRSIEHLGGYTSLQNEKELAEAITLTKKLGIYNCPTLDWAVMAFDIQYPNDVKNRLTNRVLSSKITKNWAASYKEYLEEIGGEEKLLSLRAKRKPAFEKKKKVLRLLYEKDCLLLVGSDGERPYQAAGFNLWEEMKNWSDLGIDNYTILKSATLNAAKFFRQEHQWGSVEEGKDADLIILNKNPLLNIENISTLQTTIIKGKVFKPKEIIEKLY